METLVETLAQLSNIVTALIAVGASIAGSIWWFRVRQRRREMVRKNLEDILDKMGKMDSLFNKIVEASRDDEHSDSTKNRFLLMMIDRRISNMYYLFFLHFIHSNLRPHERIDLLDRLENFAKGWELRWPILSPLKRRDVKRPTSSEEQ